MSQNYNISSQSSNMSQGFPATQTFSSSQNLSSSQEFYRQQALHSQNPSSSQDFSSRNSISHSQEFQSSQSYLSQDFRSSQESRTSQAFPLQNSQPSQNFSSSQESQCQLSFPAQSHIGRLNQCGHPPQAQVQNAGLGQNGVCFLCTCNKIRNSVLLDSSSQDILHNYRIMHSVLTTAQPMVLNACMRDVRNGIIDILDEASRVTRNFPELVDLVSDCLLAVTNMDDFEIQEYLVDKFVCQVKREPTSSYSLKWLQGVLQKEECLSIFFRKYGFDVLPNLCFTIGTTKDDESLLRMYRFLIYCFTQSVNQSFQRQFEKLFIGNSSQSGETGPVVYFLSYILQITVDVIRILKETQSETLMSVIMEFLLHVFQSETAVGIAFQSSGGQLCTTFRIVLNKNSAILQKQGIQVLTAILRAYEANMMKGMTSVNFRYVTMSSIPLTIIRSDVDYFLMQSMHTLDMRLFNDVIEFFDRLVRTSNFPLERTETIVEQSLRDAILTIGDVGLNGELYLQFILNAFSTLKVISYGLQEKILALFSGVLSSSVFSLELKAAYCRVLTYCTDSNLKSNVRSLYDTLVSSDEPLNSITPLKLLLGIVETVLNCGSSGSSGSQEEPQVQVYLQELMKARYLTAIFGLLHTRKPEEDKFYIIALLRVMTDFSPEVMIIQKSCLAERIGNVQQSTDSDVTLEILIPHVSINESSSWTGEIMMEIAFLIRKNPGLMRQVEIYQKWNQFMARILQHVASERLPQVTLMWQPSAHKNVCSEEETRNHFNKFWTTGLAELPLDFTNWSSVLTTSMFNSQDNGGHKEKVKYAQDTFLLSFYAYYLYAPNARTDFLTPDLFSNLSQMINSVILNRRGLHPAWDHLCFYLNIAILLASSVWFDPALHPVSKQKIIEMLSFIEVLLKERRNTDLVSMKKLITFRWNVILLLSEFKLFPTELFHDIVEHWVNYYFEDFEYFLEIYRPSKGNSREAGLVLRNALTSILASGNPGTSSKLLLVWRNRNQNQDPSIFLEFDEVYVYSTLFRLMSQVRTTIDFEDFDSEPLPESVVHNISTFLEVVIEMPYTTTAPFMPDFCNNFIRYITKSLDNFLIVNRGLTLLEYWLRMDCLKHSLMTSILSDKRFRDFLEKCLSFQSIAAQHGFISYRIMSILALAAQKGDISYVANRKMEWSLFYMTQAMEYASGDLSYLTFLNTMLLVDFQSPLVSVLEAPASADVEPTDSFIEIFYMITFHLENLIHKYAHDVGEALVWGTLAEMTNYARRRCPPPPCDWNDPFPNDVKLLKNTVLHASIRILLECLITGNASCLTVSLETLSYLETWAGIVQAVMESNDPAYNFKSYLITEEFMTNSLMEIIVQLKAWVGVELSACSAEVLPSTQDEDRETKKELGLKIYGYCEAMMPLFKDVSIISSPLTPRQEGSPRISKRAKTAPGSSNADNYDSEPMDISEEESSDTQGLGSRNDYRKFAQNVIHSKNR